MTVQQQVISSITCQRHAGKTTLDELDRRDILKGSILWAIIVLERLPEWVVVSVVGNKNDMILPNIRV